MPFPSRIFVALIFASIFVRGAPAKGAENMMSDQIMSREFKGNITRAFSAIGDIVAQPVAIEKFEDLGYGFTFYVGWGAPNPAIYSEVNQVVQQFRGRLTWSIRAEFNNRGAFISALPLAKTIAVPFNQDSGTVSIANLKDEIEQFCNFTQDSLQVIESVHGSNEELLDSAEPFEGSVYQVVLVARPEAFRGDPTSSSDRTLHFGFTEDDWLFLTNAPELSLDSLSNDETPLLAGLKQRYEIVRLSLSQVALLERKLIDWKSHMIDKRLEEPIRKLQRICHEALVNGLGVVFVPND